jgi:hypothetical protein
MEPTPYSNREGWLYVAAVVDLFSRRVVGWSMSAGMTAQLVTDALVMAIWRRGKPDALLHHSDRGSQYKRTVPAADDGSRCGLSRALRAREEANRCLYSNRTRAGRLHVGRRSRGAIRPNVTALRITARVQAGAEPTAGKLPAKLWAATPTPAIRQGTSRTNTRTCGSQPAHQSLITDVLQAPPPPVCDEMVRSPERTVQRALAG